MDRHKKKSFEELLQEALENPPVIEDTLSDN